MMLAEFFSLKRKRLLISQTINEVKKISFFKFTFQKAISKLAFTLCSNPVQFFKTQSCIKKLLKTSASLVLHGGHMIFTKLFGAKF